MLGGDKSSRFTHSPLGSISLDRATDATGRRKSNPNEWEAISPIATLCDHRAFGRRLAFRSGQKVWANLQALYRSRCA